MEVKKKGEGDSSNSVVLVSISYLVVSCVAFMFLLNSIEKLSSKSLGIQDFRRMYVEAQLPNDIKVFTSLYKVLLQDNAKGQFVDFELGVIQDSILVSYDSGTTNKLKYLRASWHSSVSLTNPAKSSGVYVGYILVLMAMGLAGFIGALLANFMAIFQDYSKYGKIPQNRVVPYNMRPYSGLICGVLMYFLVTLVVSATSPLTEVGVVTFKSMITLLGFAILAGFSSQEFSERLKLASAALWGSDKSEAEDPNSALEEPETDKIPKFSDQPAVPKLQE